MAFSIFVFAGSMALLGAAPPGRYTIAADSITDTVTGLTWQRRVVEGSQRLNWSSARLYCEALTLEGRDDWRLPNVKELQTLVDEGAAMPPVVDTTAFPSTPPSPFWTATESVSDMQSAFAVPFENGSVLAFRKSFTFLTRCVR